VNGPGESEIWRPKGIAAVLDTSSLVRAWLSQEYKPSAARDVVRVAGLAYDSVTSPWIIDEVEEVLARPRFGASREHVRLWLDAFLRVSRQVFPEIIPENNASAVGGDVDDVPVLHTALAAAASGEDMAYVLTSARADGGWFIVSENTRHFPPGRNVYGWKFITSHEFLGILHHRAEPIP
jgi:predicted nucleic acid-binding protein